MTVGSEAKGALDGGAIPPSSTKKDPPEYFYTQREWDRLVGWGAVPFDRSTGLTSFDRAMINQADSPKDD